jgi:hypothetical protein
MGNESSSRDKASRRRTKEKMTPLYIAIFLLGMLFGIAIVFLILFIAVAVIVVDFDSVDSD